MALVDAREESPVGDVVVQDVGDLELAATGRREVIDDVERVGPQEVHADRDEVALRLFRLLLETDHVAVAVQLGDAEPLRVGHAVEQAAGAPRTRLELAGDIGELGPAQDVVAEDDAERLVADEVAGEADGVRDAERAALVAVREVEAEVVTVGQELHDVADALAADDHHHVA